MEKYGAIIIEGHIQGLSNARSLGEAGIPVYIVDKNNCIARYSKYCKKYFRCPEYNTDDFVTFLISLAENENIHNWVLIPSNDHAVYSISKHKAELNQYYKIITADFNIIANIYDKSSLLAIAEKCGVSIPGTVFFAHSEDNIPGHFRYPVLIKGRNGLTFYKTTGKKAFLAKNESQLRDQLNELSKKFPIEKTFVQELIPYDGTNKTISFTAFCEYGEIKTYWMGEKLREHPVRFGTATFARSNYVEDCYQQSITLLKALRYTGVCEVEYLKDPRDGKFKLIEINARSWLWVGLAKACGIDYAKIIYDFILGHKVAYPSTYKIGVNWVNWFIDIPYSLISVIKGIIKPKDYFRSLKGPKVDAFWCSQDKKPYFLYIILLPFFKLTR
jgi:D-aspartate ligase